MAFNSLQKLRDNIAAIRIALGYREGVQLSETDAAALRKYAGFGGLKAVLFPAGERSEWEKRNASKADLQLYPSMMELHQLLKDNLEESDYRQAVAAMRESIVTAFYTPEIVPQTLFSVLKEQGIEPKRAYEPSSGAGVFIIEALKAFPDLQQISAVEKDLLTGKVLTALASSFPVPTSVQIKGLEETDAKENGRYDIITSNIPFGNYKVFDPELRDPAIAGSIHNYFFAKGLDKLAEGGILAFLTTDAFLNSPSNREAREYLFDRADFISVTIMPDNLMKDTANTEAASHLLVVQKNTTKEHYSIDEMLLIATIEQQNEFGSYQLSEFIHDEQERITAADTTKAGQNQYGQAHQMHWQEGPLEGIAKVSRENLADGIGSHFNREAFQQAQERVILSELISPDAAQKPTLHYLPMPESKVATVTVQLGLFDTQPAESINRAMDYINPLDETVIHKETARILGMVHTADNPGHEALVLLTAKHRDSKHYLYKFYANFSDLPFSANWMNGALLSHELSGLSSALQEYNHDFSFSGDQSLKEYFRFGKNAEQYFTSLNAFHQEGSLVMLDGKAGHISRINESRTQALFTPLGSQQDAEFYGRYTKVRDHYLALSETEATAQTEYPSFRRELNASYQNFAQHYGELNRPANRRLILADEQYGFKVLSSVERKEDEQFLPADILAHPVFQATADFQTDDPVSALARCLNEKGVVDPGFIAHATGLTADEVIISLQSHICLNPANRQWETVDQYLSGNVVQKLAVAENAAEENPDDPQLAHSLREISRVQPEPIPFELLDFNLGERWFPLHYYERFASDFFELPVTINYMASGDSFKVGTQGTNLKISREFAISPKESNRTTYGYTLLEHALENTSPYFSYEVDLGGGQKKRYPDNEAIQLAHQKIEQIRTGFVN